MQRFLPATLLAATLLAPLAAPAPAAAQTVIRACIANSAAVILRTRFAYNDWQGTRHASAWVASAAGARNCVTLQDVSALKLEVDIHTGIGGWVGLCNRDVDGRRTVTLYVTGTGLNPTCSLEQ